MMNEFINQAGLDKFIEIKQEEIELATKQKYQSIKDIRRMAVRIKSSLDTDKKVIIVSHSQGNIYANLVYDELLHIGVSKTQLDKYYGNLQVGTVAKEIRAKNSRYYTSDKDNAVNYLRARTDKPIMPANYDVSLLGCGDFTCHLFTESYLSDDHYASGYQQGMGLVFSRSFKDIFLDSLEEVAWMLANNDEDCCNGSDGRFYRKDYYTPATEAFIGNNVIISKGTVLNFSRDSNICGSSKISGKITMSNSKIYGAPVIEAGSESGLVMISSTIDGSPTIKDDLVIRNATVEGTGVYSGQHHINYVYSEIGSGTFRGTNNFSGYYNIKGNVEDSTVQGQSLVMSGFGNPHFTLLVESLPNTNFRTGLDLRGVAYLNATIGPGTKISGSPTLVDTFPGCSTCGRWFGGVITKDFDTQISSNTTGSEVIPTEIAGGVYLGVGVKIKNGSKITGSGQRLDRGIPAIHLNTTVDNSTMSGGFYATSATIISGSNVSGTSYICTSNLIGATVSGNAVTCTGNYTGSYGQHWVCNAYDPEHTNTSFPSQCNIDDGSFTGKANLYSAMSNADLVNQALLNQKLAQEENYLDVMNSIEEVNYQLNRNL